MRRAESLDSLIEKLGCGDSGAAAQAFVAYEPYLRKVVRRLLPITLRPKFDSMDVVQSVYGDVLCALRSGGARFTSPGQLRAFLVRATRNRFIDRLRQHQPAVRRERALGDAEGDGVDDTADTAAAHVPPSPRPRPSEEAEARELWARLLALCPPQYHRLLDLRRHGATAAEIAAELGMHEGSVRRVLRNLSLRLACASAPPAPVEPPAPQGRPEGA